MSASEEEDFMDDFVNISLEETMQKNDGNQENSGGIKINLPYTIMTAFAEKNWFPVKCSWPVILLPLCEVSHKN